MSHFFFFYRHFLPIFIELALLHFCIFLFFYTLSFFLLCFMTWNKLILLKLFESFKTFKLFKPKFQAFDFFSFCHCLEDGCNSSNTNRLNLWILLINMATVLLGRIFCKQKRVSIKKTHLSLIICSNFGFRISQSSSYHCRVKNQAVSRLRCDYENEQCTPVFSSVSSIKNCTSLFTSVYKVIS